MKRLVTFAVIVAIVRRTEQKIHYAVAPLTGNEQYYTQTKNSRMFERRNEEEDQTKKLQICETILGSPLFRTRYQCEASLNPQDVLEELRLKYPRIYQQAKSANNVYRVQSTMINGKLVEERVFFCLGRQSGSRNIVQYLVSTEYNLDPNGPRRSVGRFVFLDDNVIALAEEPAIVQETDSLKTEKAFWEHVYDVADGPNEALCKLTSLQKIRLCNSILNAEEYRRKVEFLPEAKNVEPPCQLRKLRFDYEEVVEKDPTALVANVYKSVGPIVKWMIPCKVTLLESRENTTRFIMRGYLDRDHHQFYVGMASPQDTETNLESVIGKKQQEEAKKEQKQESAGPEDEPEPDGEGDNEGESIFNIFGNFAGFG